MSQPITDDRITVQAPVTTVDLYQEVMHGISSGSYAVLLAIAVVYVMTRKAIGSAWVKHFDMLDTLKSVQASNAQSLKLIADSNKRIADMISDSRVTVDKDTIEEIRKEILTAQINLEGQIGNATTPKK